MQRRTALLSLFALLIGAVLCCLAGMPDAPQIHPAVEADALAESVPANMRADTVESRRQAAGDEAAAGFYGARSGSRFSWRFQHETAFHLETRAQPGTPGAATTTERLAVPVRGVLHMQVQERQDDTITLLVQGSEVQAPLPADAEARGRAAARSMSDALQRWFLVRITASGTVEGFAFQAGYTPRQRNFVRSLIAGLFHTVPATPDATWQAEEADATGQYLADYRLLDSGVETAQVERVKQRYTSIGKQATLPEHALAGRSRAHFDRRTHWLAGVQVDETMILDIAEFPSRVHVAVKARFEVCTTDWRGVDVDATDWPTFVAASGAGEDLAVGSAADEREQWRRKTAQLTLHQLLAELRALIENGATRSAAFYQAWETLSWKLRLDPAAVAAAERLLLNRGLEERTGGMLLSALGKAGSPRAQDALLAIHGAIGLGDEWRESAAMAMFQLAEPTVKVLQTITDSVRDLRAVGRLDAASLLLLGTIAPRNAEPLAGGESALTGLLGLEGRARDLGATAVWLDALGNAAVPAVAPIAKRYVSSQNPTVRESAIAALHQSGATGIAPILIEAATNDPARYVRIIAIEALGARNAESGRRTVRTLAVEARDPAVRRAAIRAVAGRGRLDASDRAVLEQVARTDADQELRAAAADLLRR